MQSVAIVAWALTAVAGPADEARAAAHAGRTDAAKVRKALDNARYFLIRQLDEQTGRSRFEYDKGGWREGVLTALVAWALTAAGEDCADNPVLKGGYEWLMAHPGEYTEFVSLRASAIAAVRKKDAALFRCLARDAKWLLKAASPEGYFGQGSRFGKQSNYDSLCADWATIALTAAAANDVLVPQEFWKQHLKAWLRTQLPDGRWNDFARGPHDPESIASFTGHAAGLCALTICRDRLEADCLSAYEKRCLTDALQRGTTWLDKRLCLRPRRKGDVCYATYRFPVKGMDAFNPGEELRWHWLLNAARVCAITGRHRWGGVDPCALLTREMLGTQNDDGSWGGGWEATGIWRVQLTSFATLFLTSCQPAASPETARATEATEGTEITEIEEVPAKPRAGVGGP